MELLDRVLFLAMGVAVAHTLLALMWLVLWLCCQFGVAFLGW